MSAAPLVTIFASKAGDRINAARPMDLAEIERVIRATRPAPEKDRLPLLKLARFGDVESKKHCLRHDANVVAVTGIEGDYDGEQVPMQHAAETLSALGLAGLLYTSASHRPEAPRWRVIVPLSRPLEGAEAQLREQRRHWAGVLNAILGGVLKSESFPLSQSYYFGPIAGQPEPQIIRLSGACLDELENAPAPLFPLNSATTHKAKAPADDGIREDRSADLLARVGKLVREGKADHEIHALQAQHPHALDQADGERAVQRAIDRVRAERPAAQAAEQQHESDAPRSLAGIDFADMRAHLNDGYLIKGVLGLNILAAIIGPTSCGKTFFAGDLAMHIAAGKPWRGHRTRGGLVIYVGLEGPVSAENRFVAAREDSKFPRALPLRLTPGPISLRDPLEVMMLTAFVQEAERTHGKCSAIFIDTLSRAMAGGDENASGDMGAVVQGADTVRQLTGATVILVHHLGKDQTRGARGHSLLKAALDTEIEITAKDDGLRVATVTKQRDLPGGTQFAFRLQSAELGRDGDGDPVTSCLVAPVGEIPADRRQQPSGKNQLTLLAALQEWQRSHPDAPALSSIELREIGKMQKLPRQRLQEATEGLERFGWLIPSVGGYRFVTEEAHQ